MVVKLAGTVLPPPLEFECSVNLYGSKTGIGRYSSPSKFECSVNLYGSKTRG